MARYNDLDDQFNGLNIDDEENYAFVFGEDVEIVGNQYELCVVGRFLTVRNINVNAMKTKMTDVWRPAMGVNIKELEPGIFLFQFYHKEDMNWVLKGGPWSFDNAMIVMSENPDGEKPQNVPLWHVNMWMQICDILSGFMSETVGKHLGDFFEEFLEYDSKNNSSVWREFMRIKVRFDVRKSLKRKKKITKKNGVEVMVSCKYERLGEFCFTCGLLTHTERYCRKFLGNISEGSTKDWGSWLRAPLRRVGIPAKSRWLREEDDKDWESSQGRYSSGTKSGGFSCEKEGRSMIIGSDKRQDMQSYGYNTYSVNVAAKKLEVKRGNSNLEVRGETSNVFSGDGLDKEEMTGLFIADRKRMRGSPDGYDTMDTPGGLLKVSETGPTIKHNEVVLSELDCAASNEYQLAKLAQQARWTS